MAETKDTINSVSVKPIIFSTPMVRALLEGRKTQTRRVMKVQPLPYAGGVHPDHVAKHPAPYIDAYCSERKTAANPRGMSHDWQWWTEDDRCGPYVGKCPYVPGNLLWVRETLECARGEAVGYPSDCSWLPNTPWTWKKDTLSAMCMPRWASRITLRVTGIRAERLQDISENDARAEGANFHDGDPDEYGMCRRLRVEAKDDFRHIWEDCYHKDSPKAWHRNPWVWVYEFEVIRKNVGEVN